AKNRGWRPPPQGNIPPYVCPADARVLAFWRGIYEPQQYLRCLNQFRLLAPYVDLKGKAERDARLRDYHRRQAEALAKNEAPAVLVNNAQLTKRVIERALSIVLVAAKDAANYPGMALDAPVPAA